MLSLANFSFWLNFTDLEPKIATAPLSAGSTPRWAILGTAINSNNQSLSTSCIILIIDELKEKQIGLGREWSAPILGKDQTDISSSALRTLGLQPNSGDVVILELDPFALIQTLGITGGQSSEAFIANLILQYLSQNLNGMDLTNVTVGELVQFLEQILGPINIDLTGIIGQIFGIHIYFFFE